MKMAYLFKFMLLNVNTIVILTSETLKIGLVLVLLQFLTLAIKAGLAVFGCGTSHDSSVSSCSMVAVIVIERHMQEP